jgi:8-oxo-dGTP diphosphatase
MADYPKPALTADTVIFTDSEPPALLLIQRANDPFAGQWALPGGFVDEQERTRSAATRELKEETGLEVHDLDLVGIYDTPRRDPRGWTVSATYWGVVPDGTEVTGSDDAGDARWFPIDRLPTLAFDHDEIVRDALVLLG